MFDRKSYMKEYLKHYRVKWAKENREHINELQRQRRKENPEKNKEYYKKGYLSRKAKHPNYLVGCNDRAKRYRKTNPVEMELTDRRSALKKKHNISIEQYKEMYDNQFGLCNSCGFMETAKTKKGKIKRLAVDHDHQTGIIRGLLCSKCNQGIGLFGDSTIKLKSAIDYLENYHNFPLDESIFYAR